MLPRRHPDRIRIAFDDHRLVANAGLLLPATLALHLGLPQLVDRRLDLGDASGRANPGDKISTLVAGGRRLHRRRRCVAHRQDGLRSRPRSQSAIHPPLSRGQALGAFLRSFTWGHVRQLDRVSRQLLARAWQAGAGPGDAPFTIDLDSTICETYGSGQGGRPPPQPAPYLIRGLHRRTGLSPASGCGRRHRRRADGPAARGPDQHRPQHRPLPA